MQRALRRIYALLVLVLGISFVAKVADQVPLLDGSGLEKVLKDTYEYLRDMSLLIATGGDVLFRLRALELGVGEERRLRGDDVAPLLLERLHEARSLLEQVGDVRDTAVSETIDNMGSVYQNIGETDDLIGLYPYAPLHDMRRALQTLDPRKNPNPDAEARNLVRDAILQSFYALRETFLEELDLQAPDHPLLISGGRRAKKSGATSSAHRAQDRQRTRQDRSVSPDPRIDDLLAQLYAKENSTAKPWRQPAGAAASPPNGRGA